MNPLSTAKKAECSGTIMYLNAISDGHIQFLNNKAKKLRKKDDAESNQDAEIMIKKIQTEKIAQMTQKQKYGLFQNQLGGTFHFYVLRIKWSFHRIRNAVIAVRDSFAAAIEDGSIDDNEANEIAIKSLLIYQYALQAMIYIRRADRINLFIKEAGKKIPVLLELSTKNDEIIKPYLTKSIKIVEISMKIKTSANDKAELAKVKKTVDADILILFKLLKIEGEKEEDEATEVKPCD